MVQIVFAAVEERKSRVRYVEGDGAANNQGDDLYGIADALYLGSYRGAEPRVPGDDGTERVQHPVRYGRCKYRNEEDYHLGVAEGRDGL